MDLLPIQNFRYLDFITTKKIQILISEILLVRHEANAYALVLESQISPIFNMAIMEHLDFWIVFGISMAGLTASFLILQNRQRAKTASADLSLRMIGVVRREDFRKILRKISDGKSHELEIMRYTGFSTIMNIWQNLKKTSS